MEEAFRMRLKRYITVCITLILLCGTLVATAAGTPGSAQDPVVSLSYIQNTFIPKVMDMLASRVSSAFGDKEAAASAKAEAALREAEKNLSTGEDRLNERVAYSAYMRLLDEGFYMDAGPNSTITLAKGERVVVGGYGEFSVVSGSAVIEGNYNTLVINVTVGGKIDMNTPAVRNSRYIAAEDRIVAVRALSDGVKVSVRGRYQIVPVYRPQYADMAELLKSIDIFRGSNKGFELEREPTRLEALIMFLRLIGEEQQALEFTGSHPFVDVPKWSGNVADKYVAYAYAKGYTYGVSKNRFAADETVSLEQYITFVLRALGYKDETDFVWSESPAKALKLGLIVEGDEEKIVRRGFRRDHVVYVSYYSLHQNLKNTGVPLAWRLVEKGLVSQEQADRTLAAFRR
jgi:hypothetical protein